MRLEYGDICIRSATAEDAPLLASCWNDGAVMAHAGFPNGLGITAEKIAEDLSADSDDTRRRLILLLKERPISEMCYYNKGTEAEIGIKICEPSYQEKGIGRLALSMPIQYLLGIGYKKIILDTDLRNTRAQHVYELLGFQKSRVNLDCWQDQLGQLQSAVDYELTAETFRNFAVSVS